MNEEKRVNEKVVKDVLKVVKVIELLKKPNVHAVDLNELHLRSNNSILTNIIGSREDLEIIGDQVRKVDRKVEIARYKEILKNRITSYHKEISALEYFIKTDEERLKKIEDGELTVEDCK